MGILLKKMASSGCEKIYTIYDKASSLKAIIAIHNTVLGPALGGCRMIPYKTEEAALDDVIQLAKIMTYKSAFAGLNYGGGKAVIMPSSESNDPTSLFKEFGRFVNSLQGTYITAIDSGTTVTDMDIVSEETPYVTGYTHQKGYDLSPSYYTVLGVVESLRSCLQFKYGDTSLKNKKILIKGVGSVGMYLADYLKDEEAHVYITDITPDKMAQCIEITGTTGVAPNAIYNTHYDILCPCDFEYTVTERNVKDLNVDIIVGSVNNQLENDALAKQLYNRGILYCPDYIANAGGLIYAANLYENKPIEHTKKGISEIRDTTTLILKTAQKEKIPPLEVANAIAESRFLKNIG